MCSGLVALLFVGLFDPSVRLAVDGGLLFAFVTIIAPARACEQDTWRREDTWRRGHRGDKCRPVEAEPMPADDAVLRAARNAFLLLLLALVVISTYQFVTVGGLAPEIGAIWVVGVGTYYGSRWYYGREDDATSAEAGDAREEN